MKDKQEAVEKWFAGLRSLDLGGYTRNIECDKCHDWRLFDERSNPEIDAAAEAWKQKHFLGQCQPAPVSEPVLPGDCACSSWTSPDDDDFASPITRHHPMCDGTGRGPGYVRQGVKAGVKLVDVFPDGLHLPLTAADAGKLQAALEKPEPAVSLQLLVIDLGDTIVIKAEVGECTLKLGGVGYQVNQTGVQTVQLYSFADVKAAIEAIADGKKPVPRLEYLEPEHQLCIIFKGSITGKIREEAFSETYLKALCQIAGVEIPIYKPKKGEWKQIGIESDGRKAEAISIWRYTLEGE